MSFTEKQVIALRKKYHNKKVSIEKLSLLYERSPSFISKIVTGKAYAKFGGPTAESCKAITEAQTNIKFKLDSPPLKVKVSQPKTLSDLIRAKYLQEQETLMQLQTKIRLIEAYIKNAPKGSNVSFLKKELTEIKFSLTRLVQKNPSILSPAATQMIKARYELGNISKAELAKRYGLPVHHKLIRSL